MSKKELSFAQAFQKLEKVSEEISDPKLDLEQSVELLEEGLNLSSICKKKLSQIENKVLNIQAKYNSN